MTSKRKASKKIVPSKKKSISPVKEGRLKENLAKTITQFMEGKRYKPMGQGALLKRLTLPLSLHPACKEVILKLIEEGIIETRNKCLVLKKKAEKEEETTTGILRVHSRGFGFVIPDSPLTCSQDVFIPKHLTDNAVDGDRVEVLLLPSEHWEKGPEGRVISILKRGRTHLAGTIVQELKENTYLAYVPLLGQSKRVHVHADTPLKIGDRCILKVSKWSEDQEEATSCDFSHLIGHISDPSCDIKAAIEEFELCELFSKASLKQAEKFGDKILKKDLKNRKDLTELTCITIDPETAKDFDDALSISKDTKGNLHLGVHIADVAHYVPSGSALDKEASERCNSTYFPGSCIPMLPEALSNHLCSLRPDVIRLTMSVLMTFDEAGELLNYQILRSFIQSRKRFTYEEAKQVLDGKKKSIFSKSLKLMQELCLLLKKKRYERGSIDFSLPEQIILINDKGEPTGTKRVEYDITHQLVEEFMLKANELVAKHLSDQGKPVLYRVHEEPSSDNLEDFFAFGRSLGFKIPSSPSHDDLKQLFEEAKNSHFSSQLAIQFIRSMKIASYSNENVGHYGLALEYYCHFTSPIRRYSDLIIQRLLCDEEDKNNDFEKISLKCSERERLSFKAESSVKLLKKLRLLNSYLKGDPSRIYKAFVTRVKPFGLYFELEDLMMDGFLHISALENDYFYYDAQKVCLKGRSSGKIHAVGETLQVMLDRIDLVLLEAAWSLATVSPRTKKQFKKKSR